MQWNKARLKQLLLEQLNAELAATLYAAETARDGATHEDAVAKSKYDTHGLELSYLAGSQFERARLLQSQIQQLAQFDFRTFTSADRIEVGTLVGVGALNQASSQHFYLLSLAGAGRVLLEPETQRKVQVISAESPLGEELIGLQIGDRYALPERKQAVFTVVFVA